MNYRHAFHAGNFADTLKHAILVALLQKLLQKPKPFLAIDSHAGVGLYDLGDERARRTGEAAGGIERLLALPAPDPALAPYLDLVRRERAGSGPTAYPGSPRLVQRLLRKADRLIACELHPDDGADLQRLLVRDPRVAVHRRDGYEALKGLLPPAPPLPRRGLVLIDPPFESVSERAQAVAAVATVMARWPAATIALWLPIKDRPPLDATVAELAGLAPPGLLLVEVSLTRRFSADRLNGSALALINPPWQIEREAEAIARALVRGLNLDGPASVREIVPRP